MIKKYHPICLYFDRWRHHDQVAQIQENSVAVKM